MLKLIFSFYHLLILFIIPVLVVVLGFKFNTEISADLSFIYSITFMVFFPFNGNVRHYILNNNDQKFILNLIYFRFLSYFPLLILSFIICILTLDTKLIYILVMLLLGTSYWLNEIFISTAERQKSFKLVICLTILYILLIAYTIFSNENKINLLLTFLTYCLSMILVLLQIFKNYKFKINFNELKSEITNKILPQIGGTFVIGFTSFAFKLIILYQLEKSVTGTIFIAFTISGLMLTLFTYGLGPSLISNEILKKDKKVLRYINISSTVPFLLGILFIILEYNDILTYNFINNQSIFIYCIGFCFLGIPFSILGQYYKLSVVHQKLTLDIYKYDAFPNISVLCLLFVVIYYYEPYFIGLTYIYTGILTLLIYKKLYFKK